MFEIGFPELVLIAIVGLLVIGPERLPEALRTLGLWLGRLRRNFLSVKTEIEKEIGMDEIRRQLHNEAVLEEMKRIEREARGLPDPTRNGTGSGSGQPDPNAAEASEPPAGTTNSAPETGVPEEGSGGSAAAGSRRDG
jgi:sec-independent protein translocase protein TatB